MSDYVTKTNLLSALGRFKENTDNLYGTKAEASDLKSAIDANSKRITNLEQKAGDEIVVDYPSQTYGMDEVPANVAQYAKVTKLRGVGRIANNLVKNSTFDGTTNWNWNSTNIDVSTSDGILEMIMKGDEPSVGKTAWGISQAIGKVTAGHVYLICGEFNSPSSAVGYDFNNQTINGTVTANAWSPFNAVRTAIDHSTPTFYLFPAGLTNGQKMKVRNVHIVDLNIRFNTSDLSFLGETDSAKLATIQKNYPELLEPSDNGTEVVFPTYTAVKSQGVNLWNEKWIVGGLNNNTGLPDASRTNRISSEDFIPISQYKLYYYLNTADVAWLYFYDKDKNYIGRYDSTSASFTPLVGSAFMKFETWNGYGNVYKNDVQISEVINNTTTSVNTTYHPYTTDTLTIPEPVTLKRAGAVAEEYFPETGRVTHPIGSKDLSTLDWADYAYGDTGTYYAQLDEKKSGTNNGLCAAFYKSAYGTETRLPDKSFCFRSGSIIFFRDTARATVQDFKTSVTGIILYFELATPSADTYVDPILDPFIQVEGGGTIRPIQTQTTVIDSAMTAEYLSLGANA